MAALIETQGIVKTYGGVRALDGVDLRLGAGRIDAIIGPNGSGKTTLFNVLTGFTPPDAGAIRLDGRRIDRLSAHARVKLGLVRTFQVQEVFPGLSVGDVLTTAALLHDPYAEARRRAKAISEDLALPWELTSADLTPGEVRRLELGRCMATRPRMILLDEVMAGLTAPEAAFMMERIGALHRQGVEVVVVEHVMDVVRRLSEHLYVLADGKIVAEGSFDQVASDPRVIEAYLGRRSKPGAA